MYNLFTEYISKESAIAEWIGVIGTLFLGVLALFGNQIRGLFVKPELKPIGIAKTRQHIVDRNFTYQRLIVKNTGRKAAEEVRVLLTYMVVPDNFIPVPLAWTHWKNVSRNISRGEYAYIDILRKVEGGKIYTFLWPAETGSPTEPLLREFNPKYGDLRLELYERDHKIGDIILRFLTKKDTLEIVR